MKQSGLAPILIILLVAILGIGGYFAYKSSLKTAPAPVVNSTPSSSTNPISTSSAETANWKTYTSSKFKYTFKYSNDWNVVQSNEDATLLKNKKWGFNTTSSQGITISSSVEKTSLTTSSDWYEQLDSDGSSKSIMDKTKVHISLDGKDAIQYDFTESKQFFERNVDLVYRGNAYRLEIGGDTKFKDEAILEFNQILSTFRVTQ